MKNGKFAKRGVSTKAFAMILAIVALVSITVGGTIAWLMDQTPTVKNTFTVGDVVINLKESPLNADGKYGDPAEGIQNAYKLIPGQEYKKDPKVTVEAVSEKCYLFVKFEENGNAAKYIDYTSTLTTENGWTKGDGTDIPSNVWYRVVEDTNADQSWNLLDGDKITINATTVTKESMEYAKAAELVYTAYAVQFANVADPATAWKTLNA